ncbi:MAG: ABC transporter permease [Oscillospiraceae bacterium]
MDKLKTFTHSQGFVSFLASLFSILCGLVFGYLLLLVFNSDMAAYGMRQMLTSGVSSSSKFAKVLYQSAPLMMTGLSVGFAFKTGLFNIGATGQYTVGAAGALIAGIVFQMPWWACLIAAMVGGAIWGFFPGFFKAMFNVNEVLTSIMFNWIALFFVNLIFANIPSTLANYWGDSQTDRTANLAKANPDAIIPKVGLDKFMDSNYMNISIFIAILFAILMFIIISKTTFGYELRACGLNRDASLYAGINAKRNIVLSMVISGALAGVGGAIYYLAGTGQYTLVKALLDMGFNGIPVALLATSNPLATIFSALFISYIQVGGDAMQPEFAKETIDIIIAVIIYLAAFSLLMRTVIINVFTRKKQKAAAGAEEASEEEVSE